MHAILEQDVCKLVRDCVVTFADGSSTNKRLSGWALVINKYWRVLNADNKEHFHKMKAIIEEQNKQSEYALFLSEFK